MFDLIISEISSDDGDLSSIQFSQPSLSYHNIFFESINICCRLSNPSIYDSWFKLWGHLNDWHILSGNFSWCCIWQPSSLKSIDWRSGTGQGWQLWTSQIWTLYTVMSFSYRPTWIKLLYSVGKVKCSLVWSADLAKDYLSFKPMLLCSILLYFRYVESNW